MAAPLEDQLTTDDGAGLADQKFQSSGCVETGTGKDTIYIINLNDDDSSSANLKAMLDAYDRCLKIPVDGKGKKYNFTLEEAIDDDRVSSSSSTVVEKDPFSDRVLIQSILGHPDGVAKLAGQKIRIGGWVKTGRLQKKGTLAFLEVNDGSCVANLQLLVKASVTSEKLSELIAIGTCVHVDGRLKIPPGKDEEDRKQKIPRGKDEKEDRKQKIELDVEEVIHVGKVDTTVDKDKYPIHKTKHSREFLREILHLRSRTNLIASVARMRDGTGFKTHSFFRKHGILEVNTPIITTSDCEGAGEMFQVTTLMKEAEKLDKDLIENPPPTEADIESAKLVVKEKSDTLAELKDAKASKEEITASVAELTRAKESFSKIVERSKLKPGGLLATKDDGKIDYAQDFFGRQAFLSVSGQLQLESYACALGSVYTFGPAFRAENSHTSRHLAEFWMVEPELAFADLEDAMECAEEYVKYMCKGLLEDCYDDLKFMDEYVDNNECIERLISVVSTPFERITYTEAIKLLEEAVVDLAAKGKKFENKVEWGIDLASEHERYLTDVKFEKPVFVHNYPKDIKSFYMRLNDDGKTVAAFDLLVPKVGELIGGSQREERHEVLLKRMEEMKLPIEQYKWYTDLRRFGTVKHSGFGLGFERMLLFATGLDNIRDVIPFPRYPGRADL